MSINVLSLFDGFSGAMLALIRAGIDVDNCYSSEIDKYSMSVSEDAFGHKITQIGDVTKINGEKYKNIDLLIGGSPCQGFSCSGKHLGFDDARSGLFFEFLRIKKEANPKYFLLENVKMSHKDAAIISDFLGVEPVLINSGLVSAQLRSRYYWTNIPFAAVVNKGILLKDIIETQPCYRISRETIKSCLGGTKEIDADIVDGVCAFVDRDKSYCVDANYAKGGGLSNYFDRSRRQMVFVGYARGGKVRSLIGRKLSVAELERLQTVPPGYTSCVSVAQASKMLGNGFTVDVIAEILKGMKKK